MFRNVAAILLLFAGMAVAQQPTTSDPGQTTATTIPSMNVDPMAQSDDPTVIRLQIIAYQNAQEGFRSHLAPLLDFQKYEEYGALAAAQQQHLQQVYAKLLKDKQTADATASKAQSAQSMMKKQAEEAESIAISNRAKKAADDKAKSATPTPAPQP